MNTSPVSDNVVRLQKWFRSMYSAKSKVVNEMTNDEEYYFGDVERTRHQLNEKQLAAIEHTYNVPISTKVVYAIGEQVISFLTGGKPYPRIISPTKELSEHAVMYEQLLNAIWYEGKLNMHLTNAIRDMVTVGQGWMFIRENDFYNETTFNVSAEYVPWQWVYVDPTCRQPDLSDAEMVCLARTVLKTKAEKQYGITIKPGDSDYYGTDGWEMPDEDSRMDYMYSFGTGALTGNEKERYVWVRDFYEKIEANVFAGTDQAGVTHISTKRPLPKMVRNPAYDEILGQIKAIEEGGAQMAEGMAETGEALDSAEATMAEMGTDPFELMAGMAPQQAALEGQQKQAMEAGAQLEELVKQLNQTPPIIRIYELLPIGAEDGAFVQVTDFVKQKRKAIRWTLLVGNKELERKVLPTDEFPLVPFVFSHVRSFSRTFGMVHYVKDINKALNKFWSLAIYDMQVNATRKVIYPEGAIQDPVAVEQHWSQPMAWIGYTPNPSLSDGGKPEVIEGSQLNVATQQAIGSLMQLAEYITGIHSLTQGNPGEHMPDSFAGIQAIQTFGTSRTRMYSRSIEDSLTTLTYVIVRYLQAYTDKNKVLQYFDENGDKAEIQILSGAEDVKFKIRTNMTSNLPTARHMAAQILGVISGQTKNPAVADLLTTAMLRTADIPDGNNIADQVDTVKQLNQQLEQTTTELQNKEKEVSQLTQQLFQKDVAIAKAQAIAEIEKDVAVKKEQIGAASSPEQLAKTEAAMSNEQSPEEEVPF